MISNDTARMRRAEAEVRFLTTRMEADMQHDTDLIGVSSQAMVLAAMTGDPGRVTRYPSDVYDLNRCERTYESAPEHLRARMLPILRRFREHVKARDEPWRVAAMEEHYAPAKTP